MRRSPRAGTVTNRGRHGATEEHRHKQKQLFNFAGSVGFNESRHVCGTCPPVLSVAHLPELFLHRKCSQDLFVRAISPPSPLERAETFVGSFRGILFRRVDERLSTYEIVDCRSRRLLPSINGKSRNLHETHRHYYLSNFVHRRRTIETRCFVREDSLAISKYSLDKYWRWCGKVEPVKR